MIVQRYLKKKMERKIVIYSIVCFISFNQRQITKQNRTLKKNKIRSKSFKALCWSNAFKTHFSGTYLSFSSLFLLLYHEFQSRVYVCKTILLFLYFFFCLFFIFVLLFLFSIKYKRNLILLLSTDTIDIHYF